MYTRVDVVSVLIFDSNRENILMVRNKKGESSYWSLPSGAVEAGETLIEAAIRETKEETGFNVEILDLYSVREAFFTESGHHSIFFTFLSQITGGEINITDPDNEILEVKWIDIQTANNLMSFLTEKIKISSSRINNLSPYFFHGEV